MNIPSLQKASPGLPVHLVSLLPGSIVFLRRKEATGCAGQAGPAWSPEKSKGKTGAGAEGAPAPKAPQAPASRKTRKERIRRGSARGKARRGRKGEAQGKKRTGKQQGGLQGEDARGELQGENGKGGFAMFSFEFPESLFLHCSRRCPTKRGVCMELAQNSRSITGTATCPWAHKSSVTATQVPPSQALRRTPVWPCRDGFCRRPAIAVPPHVNNSAPAARRNFYAIY
eukprot:gene10092-biopygen21288